MGVCNLVIIYILGDCETMHPNKQHSIWPEIMRESWDCRFYEHCVKNGLELYALIHQNIEGVDMLIAFRFMCYIELRKMQHM